MAIEMEFVDDLTGEKVWGEVMYDSNDKGKQDLWAGRNKALLAQI